MSDAAPSDSDDFDLGVLERVEAELRGVEPALRAIEDGTYGTCGACGLTLTAEVLDAYPTGQCTERSQLPGCPSLRLPIGDPEPAAPERAAPSAELTPPPFIGTGTDSGTAAPAVEAEPGSG